MRKIARPVLALALALILAPAVWAHAFPQDSSPHVGATLPNPPKLVQIWFDGEIEPVFSTLIVKNPAGKQVSLGKGKISPTDKTLLQAALPSALPAGKYEVYWSVIARDGHHTSGHFSFTVK